MVEQSVASGAATEARVTELMQFLTAPKPDAVDRALFERLIASQERVAEDSRRARRGSRRARCRGAGAAAVVDTQVLRILEELSAGRQGMVTEIRQGLAS